MAPRRKPQWRRRLSRAPPGLDRLGGKHQRQTRRAIARAVRPDRLVTIRMSSLDSSLSADRCAAVEVQRLPGHVIGRGGREVQSEQADLAQSSGATEWRNLCGILLTGARALLALRARLRKQTGRDGVD